MAARLLIPQGAYNSGSNPALLAPCYVFLRVRGAPQAAVMLGFRKGYSSVGHLCELWYGPRRPANWLPFAPTTQSGVLPSSSSTNGWRFNAFDSPGDTATWNLDAASSGHNGLHLHYYRQAGATLKVEVAPDGVNFQTVTEALDIGAACEGTYHGRHYLSLPVPLGPAAKIRLSYVSGTSRIMHLATYNDRAIAADQEGWIVVGGPIYGAAGGEATSDFALRLREVGSAEEHWYGGAYHNRPGTSDGSLRLTGTETRIAAGAPLTLAYGWTERFEGFRHTLQCYPADGTPAAWANWEQAWEFLEHGYRTAIRVTPNATYSMNVVTAYFGAGRVAAGNDVPPTTRLVVHTPGRPAVDLLGVGSWAEGNPPYSRAVLVALPSGLQLWTHVLEATGNGIDLLDNLVFEDSNGKVWFSCTTPTNVAAGQFITAGYLQEFSRGLPPFRQAAAQALVRPAGRGEIDAMNLQPQAPLTGDGADHALAVPRGNTLLVYARDADVEIRETPLAAEKFTVPQGTTLALGPSLGQTLYLRSAAGAVVELALT